jgi:hypothetical protein
MAAAREGVRESRMYQQNTAFYRLTWRVGRLTCPTSKIGGT